MFDGTWGDPRLPDRIWLKIFVCPITGCWIWSGFINKRNYPYVSWQGKCRRTHRVVYALLVGEIPDNLELDHLCRVRYCVNPEHLEAVTHGVNTRRGDTFQRANFRKVLCSGGHPYDGVYLRKNGSTMRTCSICARRNKRAYKARKRHGLLLSK